MPGTDRYPFRRGSIRPASRYRPPPSLAARRPARTQHSFIHAWLLISGLDDFYGAAHFLAVTAVLLWLFLTRPNHYRQWRNTLALCTAAALIGFAFFPVLPPRLLPYAQFHIVDTLKTVGGLWNFSSGRRTTCPTSTPPCPPAHRMVRLVRHGGGLGM